MGDKPSKSSRGAERTQKTGKDDDQEARLEVTTGSKEQSETSPENGGASEANSEFLETWTCNRCSFRTLSFSSICAFCKALRDSDRWCCTFCDCENDATSVCCILCQRSFDETAKHIAEMHDISDQENTLSAQGGSYSQKSRKDITGARVASGQHCESSERERSEGAFRNKKRSSPDEKKTNEKRAKICSSLTCWTDQGGSEPIESEVIVIDDDEGEQNTKTESTTPVLVAQLDSRPKRKHEKLPVDEVDPFGQCWDSNAVSLPTNSEHVREKREEKSDREGGDVILTPESNISASPEDSAMSLEEELIQVAVGAWQGNVMRVLNRCRELDVSGTFEHVACMMSERPRDMDGQDCVRGMLTCPPEGPLAALRWMMSKRVVLSSKQDLVKAARAKQLHKARKAIQEVALKSTKADGCSLGDPAASLSGPTEGKRTLVLYAPPLREQVAEEDPDTAPEKGQILIEDSDGFESGLDEDEAVDDHEGAEESFDDTDDDDQCQSMCEESECIPQFQHSESSAASTVLPKTNPALPDSVGYQYVVDGNCSPPRERKALPPAWLDAWRSDPRTYHTFLARFFRGEVPGFSDHDWSSELRSLVETSAKQDPRPALSVWQAAGYKHAQTVVQDHASRGCLFWWTPGSGKSVMVALLIEHLLDTAMEIFVVSTPQNIRENGYTECSRSILKFSPVFCTASPASAQEVEQWQQQHLKRRRPPVHKKHFMSIRQFQNEMSKRLVRGKSIENVAVIVDECHELFNARLCDQVQMWGSHAQAGILDSVSRGKQCKLFLLSGTPWRDTGEMERQLRLVSGTCSEAISSDVGALLGRYGKVVSFVDGTKDRSNFPDDGGWNLHRCPMHVDQLHNFGSRSQHLLRSTAHPNCCKLALDLTSQNLQQRKAAVGTCRLLQVAGGVHLGGLRQTLDRSPVLSEIAKVAPKIAAVCEKILRPPSGSKALETLHFVYSVSQSSVTHLALTMPRVVTAAGMMAFREVRADEVEWTDDGKTHVRLQSVLSTEENNRVFFVAIHGKLSRDEKTKLKAAFGFVTPDGRRYEGLRRANGMPLIQVIMGSHETNQGLTFLRLQHIHLMEPNSLGWSKVVQTIGRGIRRGTHAGIPAAAVAMRTVKTHIYMTVNDEKMLSGLREEHAQEIKEGLSQIRDKHVAAAAKLREIRITTLSTAFPSESFKSQMEASEEQLRARLEKIAKRQDALQQEQSKAEQGWLRVPVPGSKSRSREGQRKKLVQTWLAMPDEAVYRATYAEHAARQCFDTAVRSVAVDSELLSGFHCTASAARGLESVAPDPTFHKSMLAQYAAGQGACPDQTWVTGTAECTLCGNKSRPGRVVCEAGHFACKICCQFILPASQSIMACSPDTCGYLSEANIRKVPPYWTQRDLDTTHLVKNDFMVPRVQSLLRASVLDACLAGTSQCQHGRIAGEGLVTKVLRIENGHLWTQYSDSKLGLLQQVKQGGRKIARIPDRTKPWQEIFKDVELCADINEFFLFHGTSETVAMTIAQKGFKLKFANAQGLYGGGIYFADAACKSCRYCGPDPPSVLLLSRVLVGSAFRIKTNNIGERHAPDGCDSIFAETGKARGGVQYHNEIVVFKEGRVYPEYIVYLQPPS